MKRSRPPITLTLSLEARLRLEALAKSQRRTMSGTVEWLIMTWHATGTPAPIQLSHKGRKS
jgi:hypothetical protein